MSFISLSEVKKKLYFMSAEGTNEIYNFSLRYYVAIVYERPLRQQ